MLWRGSVVENSAEPMELTPDAARSRFAVNKAGRHGDSNSVCCGSVRGFFPANPREPTGASTGLQRWGASGTWLHLWA